jgi:hypothetical protein
LAYEALEDLATQAYLLRSQQQQQLVIDRKRIFLFRLKTNIRQENAAEYSTDNEYLAQGSKHYKKIKFA